MARISGVLVTLNEAHNIRYALGSLASWCDELIVVDQHSDDGTADIARELGARVFDHERTGIADPARVFAVAQSTGDWVMILDGDEMVPATLGRHLRQFVDSDPAADIVLIPFVNIHLGRWNRAGPQNWPSRKARFFRPGAVEVSGRIHASLTPKEDARKLPADATPEMAIWHFSYPSVEVLMEKTERYTSIQARQALEEGSAPVRPRQVVLRRRTAVCMARVHPWPRLPRRHGRHDRDRQPDLLPVPCPRQDVGHAADGGADAEPRPDS